MRPRRGRATSGRHLLRAAGVPPGRLAVGFPLDAAAAGGSAGLRRCPGAHAAEGGIEVGAIRRGAGFRPGGVELPGVGEAAELIEQEEIRSAGRPEGQSDGLGFVEEVGEIPAMGAGEVLHRFRAILRVGGKVVRGDGHGFHAERAPFTGETAQAPGQVDDVGAVVAGEDDEQSTGAGQVRAGVGFPPGIGQDE